MATTVDYIEFVCSQIEGTGEIRYKKMFGEYMVYVNDKPVLLVCDNTVYVKKLVEIQEWFDNTETGFPYEGAKEHYILDIDDSTVCKKVIAVLVEIIPLPKKKK